MQEHYQSSDKERWIQEAPKSASRTEFERDRARLLHSSALRRLGAKTQVLGPESDDFIRTRLTHSLEVAQVGRSLAKNLGCDPDIVEAACLSHDIGHPPYGHNGEKALNELAEDIGGFEGNAQTLRLLTRLEPKRFQADGSPAGLNLTRATLDATIKYPWLRGAGPRGGNSRKFGVYADDLPVFTWVHGNHGLNRCIEAQIMDISDDIAYSVHDVEDAIVYKQARANENPLGPSLNAELADEDAIIAGVITWYGKSSSEAELRSAFRRLHAMEAWPHEFSGTIRDLAALKDLTSDLIGRFISALTAATKAEYGSEPLIRYAANVVVPPHTQAEINLLKGIAVHLVMEPRVHEPVYYAQRTMLYDLADALAEDPATRLEPIFWDLYQRADSEAARRRVLIDQLATLTDQSARQWHARYCGMLRH